MEANRKTLLTGLKPDEIAALLPPGKERYRGTQIYRWIHERLAESFEEMTNLPKAFRASLEGRFALNSLTPAERLGSEDGSTDKFLFRLIDGEHIESVIIRDDSRVTACISSQAGCRMGCSFCRTGGMGFHRDLSAGEILGQLIVMRRLLRADGEDITNIVFMGMGEPLDNFDAVVRAVEIITDEIGMGIGMRKLTVSTVGLTSMINTLTEQFRKIGVAVSLNAPDDSLRSRLMPVNRKHNIADIIDSARQYYSLTGRRITFEYILMAGVNDSPEQAQALLKLARRVPCKVNLIAFNEFKGAGYHRPEPDAVEQFQQILTDGHITAFIRRSKGADICAACGQLATTDRTPTS